MTAPRHRLSLTARVILLSAAGILAVTIISALTGLRLLERELAELREQDLRRLTEHVTLDLGAVGEDELRDGPVLGEPRFSEIFSGAYWQIDRAGDPPVRSRSLWDTTLPDRAPSADLRPIAGIDGPLDQQLLLLAREVTVLGKPAILQVAIDASGYDRLQADIGRFTLIVLAAEGLFALLAAAMIGYLSLRSIRRFTEEIADLRAGRRDSIGEDLPSEIAPAAQEVNALKAAQSRLISRARDQAGGLAHSLKTPLAVMMQAAEKGETVPSETVREQAGEALRHVQHHLALARSAGGSLNRSQADAAPVIDGILRVLRPRMDERGIELANECPERLPLPMDEVDLYDVLGNLLDNAVRHASGRVRIAATGEGLVIEDDGPGLSEADIGAVLERGRSLSAGEGQTGLGLTLAHEIIESYDGKLRLGRSELGGLAAAIVLPPAET